MLEYFGRLNSLFDKICATEKKEHPIEFKDSLRRVLNVLKNLDRKKNKIMFIGNGGSASISSHFAIDFLKNVKIPALAFNDASFLTCLGNDLGYEHVFDKPIEMVSCRDDVLFAISSSGRSKNVLNAVETARQKGVYVITLSGFDTNNPLRKMGDINFYVPSDSYGFVETVHSAICHYFVDMLLEDKYD